MRPRFNERIEEPPLLLINEHMADLKKDLDEIVGQFSAEEDFT